jgi:hypothetical protein
MVFGLGFHGDRGRALGHRPDEGIAGTGGVPFVGDSRFVAQVPHRQVYGSIP